jgi:hypothetical protein
VYSGTKDKPYCTNVELVQDRGIKVEANRGQTATRTIFFQIPNLWLLQLGLRLPRTIMPASVSDLDSESASRHKTAQARS